jgi:hypothetical protein
MKDASLLFDPSAYNFAYHLLSAVETCKKREETNSVFSNGLAEFLLYWVGQFDIGEFETV